MIRTTDPLAEAAEASPHTAAVRQAERSLTYRELDETVDEIAGALETVGLGPDDVVGVIGSNSIQLVQLIHAVFRLGAAVVPIDPDLPEDRLYGRLDQAAVDHTVDLRESAPLDRSQTYTSEDIDNAEHQAPTLAGTEQGESDLACIMFTSGTTGTPRAVELTWRNLRTSAMASALRLGVEPTDTWLSCLPPYHMGGFAPIVRSAIYGTTIGFMSPEPQELEQHIKEWNGSGLSLVPPLLDRCLENSVSLQELRVVLVGGDRTPKELVRRALDRDVPIHTTYGMTEAASQIATATPAELQENPHTVGHPLRWVKVSIESGSDRKREGEIVVTGPTVSPGYRNAAGGETLQDGRLKTGDVGYVDEKDRLVVSGRLAERIVSGGETIDPRTVEELLESHEAVQAASVVGLEDERWGERVGAALETTTADGERIINDLEASFRGAEQPRVVTVVEDLPRTASGTVDRQAVMELLQTAQE